MKIVIATLAFIAALPCFASTKTYSIEGAKARTMMETLASAGFEVQNLDNEWSSLKVPLIIETDAISCKYTHAYFPDSWMSSAHCHKGDSLGGTALENSLAIAQALKPFAESEGALGSTIMTVEKVRCALKYSERRYRCVITVNPMGH